MKITTDASQSCRKIKVLCVVVLGTFIVFSFQMSIGRTVDVEVIRKHKKIMIVEAVHQTESNKPACAI